MKWRENIDHNGNEIIHPLMKKKEEEEEKEKEEVQHPVNMVYETDSE